MSEDGEHAQGRVLMDEAGVQRALVRIARRLKEQLERLESIEVPFGAMDVTLYRDDLHRGADQAPVQFTDISFEVAGRTILLVDDVLFTGRTVRAALDAARSTWARSS